VDSFVDVEGGLLGESLHAEIALVGPLPRVRPDVYLQVWLASERCRTLQTLEGPALDCTRRQHIKHTHN